jgi:AcrR family transcriptional regulator
VKSQSPAAARERTALEPQRRRGKLRVAALMEAGAAVIAERGFEAATMAEVAARARAPIGSLYRFFPNKEVLADALLQRFGALIEGAFAKIDSRRDNSSIGEFANALLALLVELRSETRAVVALLEARSDWSEKRGEFHDAILRHIAEKLAVRNPRLGVQTAADMALVLLQNMKTMAALSAKPDGDARSGALAELREMTRLYLANKLGG